MIIQHSTSATPAERFSGRPRGRSAPFAHSVETPGRYALPLGERRVSKAARFDATSANDSDEGPWFSDYDEAD
jgi:hypothetical protein